MAAGHNNGFNPFRDAHGKFSGKGRADAAVSAAAMPRKGAGAMNDSLRSASGRATGSTSDGEGVTAATFAKIDAQPEAKAATFSAETNATFDAISATMGVKGGWLEGMHASFDGVNGMAFSILSQGRAQAPKAHVDALIKAYKEAGFDPPAGATQTDLLHYMDAYKGGAFGGNAEANRNSYGIAYALKAGNQGVALTLADGREGAGIGWDLTRQELGADLAAESARFESGDY